MDLFHVNSGVSCEGLAAFVARERPLPRVHPRVALQTTRLSESIVALVALKWFFSCVVFHHVNFQMTSCNAGKLAHCAYVRPFPRVGSFVALQTARPSCSIIALAAFV